MALVCSVCGLPALITAAVNRVETDAAGRTHLYRVMTYACRNKKCERFGRELGSERLEQPVEQ